MTPSGSAMSTQRIRRKGADGRDRILDVDLGPGRAAATGTAGGVAMGSMEPILRAGTRGLRSRATGEGWTVCRTFTIGSKQQRPSQRWHPPRQADR